MFWVFGVLGLEFRVVWGFMALGLFWGFGVVLGFRVVLGFGAFRFRV